MGSTQQLNLQRISRDIRSEVLKFSSRHQIAHLGSCLSTVEIITVLFFKVMRNFTPESYSLDSDQFILSKGHAAVALYAALLKKGFISENDLENFGQPGSIFEEHPNSKIPTVVSATGSLGHGLAFANGLVLGHKKGIPNESRVYVLMSDGECNSGAVWESAIFTSAKNLNRVTILVDHNKFQATGPTSETLGRINLANVFRAFGWISHEIDGHNLVELENTLNSTKDSQTPVAIICNTIKGRGVSFMENNNNWHYKAPSEIELANALKELDCDA
jgi:transketolase